MRGPDVGALSLYRLLCEARVRIAHLAEIPTPVDLTRGERNGIGLIALDGAGDRRRIIAGRCRRLRFRRCGYQKIL